MVHEYFRVEAEVIRDIVENEIAPLATSIRAYLASSENPDQDDA